MILDHHPYLFDPFLQQLINRNVRRGLDATALQNEALLKGIGYWGPDDGLPSPKDYVDPGWDQAEKAAIIAYLRSGPRNKNWEFLGYPNCRFCCGIKPEELGTGEQSDGTFIWPVGFAHYLEQHSVRPPQAFVAHVLARVAS